MEQLGREPSLTLEHDDDPLVDSARLVELLVDPDYPQVRLIGSGVAERSGEDAHVPRSIARDLNEG